MAFNFGSKIQGMAPGSLYKSFFGGNSGFGTPKLPTGQTPPITANPGGGAINAGGGTNMYAGGNPNFSEAIPPATKQPPIQPPPGGWGDYGGGAGATTTPSYSNVNSGMDGSYYTSPTNTAGQGSPLTMNANGIAPPANTAQGMPGGLGGMQGGFGGLFGNLGGGNFLGGRQHGMQPGSYGRASNPNRAVATANGPMGGNPANALSGQAYNTMNNQRIQEMLSGTTDWGDPNMANSNINTLIGTYGATPAQLAGNPTAMAAAKSLASGAMQRAQAEMQYKLANPPFNEGVDSPYYADYKASLERQYNQLAGQYAQWL